jgi:hypothetical protein
LKKKQNDPLPLLPIDLVLFRFSTSYPYHIFFFSFSTIFYFIISEVFLGISGIMFRPDRGRKHLSVSERAGIIALSSVGKPLRQIADALEVSKSAVHYWQKRFLETGELKRKSGTGGKPKLTRENIENIRSAVMAKPITTAQEIAGNVI